MEYNDANHFRQLLNKMKNDFHNTIFMLKEHDRGEQDEFSPAELSNYDNHPADLGTDLYDTEQSNALLVHEEGLLTQVEDALKRIDTGEYGKCEMCGKQIGKGRLEVIPYTQLCMECANEHSEESDELRRKRPVEEHVLSPALGRKYLNKQEDDEDEGLDILNDLMKYGSSDTPQDMGGYKDYKEFYTNEVDKQGNVDKMDNVSNQTYKNQTT